MKFLLLAYKRLDISNPHYQRQCYLVEKDRSAGMEEHLRLQVFRQPSQVLVPVAEIAM